MNYKQAARDIRNAMWPIRLDAGRWMIADMKKAWDRGDRKYVIPPGTYAINEPMPCCPGSTIDGGGKVTLHCAVLCLVEYHPAAGGGWMSGTMPPFDDDIDIWNMNEDQFKQP